MKFVRNVLHDLVEKKLWPVAIALIAGLVAVPAVLGGSSSAGTTTTPVAAAPAPNGLADHRDAARGEVISLEEQAAGEVNRDGKVRNPFVQHHLPKAQDPAKAAQSAMQATKDLLKSLAGGGTAAGAGSGSGGGGPAAPVVSTAPATGGTPTPESTRVTYDVTLKFGEAGEEKTYKNVARLTPLPSSNNPFFVFLGLSQDAKSAVFLVDADAVPSGDGVCTPSEDECEQVTLEKGDVEFFELQSGTAGVVQYQLELTGIHKHVVATTASAARAHARESRAGREYLRQLVAENPEALAGWDFSSKLGVLVAKDEDVANLPQDVADAAAGEQPSSTTPSFTAAP